MLNRTLRKLTLLFLLVLAHSAMAEPPLKAQRAAGEQVAPGADFTSYTFDDDQVLGDSAGPTVETISVLQRRARTSLIRIRETFIHELYKSVEAL